MSLQHKQSGFSVIEVLVASALLILALTGVILVSFTNQSVVSDSQAASQALDKAQALLENAQTLPFAQIAPVGSTQDGIYQTEVEVITPWDGNDKIKKITAIVTWTGDHNRAQKTELSALATNYKNEWKNSKASL